MDFKYIQTASQLSDDELVELYAQVINEVIEDNFFERGLCYDKI